MPDRQKSEKQINTVRRALFIETDNQIELELTAVTTAEQKTQEL